MTNGNQPTPRTAGGSPAMAPAATSQAPIQPADQAPATSPEEKPLGYAIKLYAVSPKGFVVEITTAAAERPVAWIGTMTDGLERLHYTPIDPYAPTNVDVDVAAPAGVAPGAPSAAGGGVATWIAGDGGGPPRCSAHGPAKWVEGDNDKGHYAFWACSYNTKDHPCKPKGKPA